MSCPCKMCNAQEFFTDIHYRDGRYRYEPTNEVEVGEPKTMYDRLSKVTDQLEKYGVPAHFINDLNQLCEDIDSLDSKVIELQKEAVKRPIDYTQFKLGELSKELM
jgi:hypothetical protein